MTVNEEVYEMICESGLTFKINSQIFIVDKKRLHRLKFIGLLWPDAVQWLIGRSVYC